MVRQAGQNPEGDSAPGKAVIAPGQDVEIVLQPGTALELGLLCDLIALAGEVGCQAGADGLLFGNLGRCHRSLTSRLSEVYCIL
ncbi:MAG: hypothetical protein TUN42_06385 [Dehalogenimonas sp.]